MIISKRLRAISDFIPDNSFVLDIGCDHALLDIYVTTTKKNVKAIASDINEKPLKQAQENIKKYSAKKVTLSLGDGLSSYKAGVDTVVLSGLGSTTIVSILKNDKEVLKNINRIIVSSNNDYYFLRKSICELGFYIKEEKSMDSQEIINSIEKIDTNLIVLSDINYVVAKEKAFENFCPWTQSNIYELTLHNEKITLTNDEQNYDFYRAYKNGKTEITWHKDYYIYN